MNVKKVFISNLQELMVEHYEANLKTQMDVHKTLEHTVYFQAYADTVGFMKTEPTIDELEDFLIFKSREYNRVILNVEGEIDFLLTAIFKKKAEAFESILDYSNYYWKGVD